jgi:hypothetical protein
MLAATATEVSAAWVTQHPFCTPGCCGTARVPCLHGRLFFSASNLVSGLLRQGPKVRVASNKLCWTCAACYPVHASEGTHELGSHVYHITVQQAP